MDAHYAPGEVIVREGEPADSLYLLASGTVEASVRAEGSERSVTSIEAPAAVGELGLLLSERTATVRAITAVQTWRIPRDSFERLIRDRPALALAIARSLAGTIDERDRRRVGAPLPAHAGLRSVLAMPPSRPSRIPRVVAAGAAVAIPAALWLLPPPAGLTPAAPPHVRAAAPLSAFS